mmetsp:Transcript_62379/g.201163  ORF Transcript_62379/g.201163 Transcript_62379/m.201163 type:complete len:228 (+) Transcript_62379:335-1018(+)
MLAGPARMPSGLRLCPSRRRAAPTPCAASGCARAPPRAGARWRSLRGPWSCAGRTSRRRRRCPGWGRRARRASPLSPSPRGPRWTCRTRRAPGSAGARARAPRPRAAPGPRRGRPPARPRALAPWAGSGAPARAAAGPSSRAQARRRPPPPGAAGSAPGCSRGPSPWGRGAGPRRRRRARSPRQRCPPWARWAIAAARRPPPARGRRVCTGREQTPEPQAITSVERP